MIDYKIIDVALLDKDTVDKIYGELLQNKWQFVVLAIDGKLFVLTKEKSLFEINNIEDFLSTADKDLYYKTVVTGDTVVDEDDLKLYREYIDKYRQKLIKTVYGGKYLFGSIAVRSDNGFITTIRGKENLSDYTIVKNVDHDNRMVTVAGKKATLNAALLDWLFKRNKLVKVIVHLNSVFDDGLPTEEYAFPGTVRDSQRDMTTSFNIRYHGLFYLINNNGEKI
jgi:hypothetical protein